MKTKINNLTGLGMALGLTALTALTPGQAIAAGNSSHSGGGGHNGGFYATVSTVSELISDINYANTAGGAFTVNLAAGTTFNLKNVDNTTDGGNALPVIGAGVELTIIGNGDTINRIATYNRRIGYQTNPMRFFEVASGGALALEDLTLNNGYLNNGGGGAAVYNEGTLTLGSCTLTNEFGSDNGGAIYNDSGGTVTIDNSTLSDNYTARSGAGIYNDGGTLTINNCTLSGNFCGYGGAIYINGGTVVVNDSDLSGNTAYSNALIGFGGNGGGIYNAGGTLTISGSIVTYNTGSGGGLFNDTGGAVTVENYSSLTGNAPDDVVNLGALSLDSTSMIGILDGNPYTPI